MAANSLKLTVLVLFMVKVSGPTSGEAPPDGCGDQKKKTHFIGLFFHTGLWPVPLALHQKCLN